MFVQGLVVAKSSTRIYNNTFSAWNSTIVQCFRDGDHKVVLEIYLNLRRKNVGIHGVAINFALKSSVELGAYEFGVNLHGDALKSGLSCDRYVGSSLIGFYSGYDRIANAAQVFDEIPGRDLVAYTSMITAYARASTDNFISNAYRVAYDMQMDRLQPNRVALVSLLQCSSRLGALDEGKSIHGYAVRRQIGYNDEVFKTSLMHMYIKCCDLPHGNLVFKDLREKTAGPWNVMISGHLEAGQPLDAFKLFLQMVVEKCELDLISLSNGLWACAESGNLLAGKMVQAQILRRGFILDLIGTTALVDMYCKCNDLPSAENIFAKQQPKDGALFHAMISGFLHSGCVSRATQAFTQMITMFIVPNAGTIISILSVLSEIKDVKTGKSIHGYAFRQGMEKNIDISNQFIDMYSKCGSIEYARRVFYGMNIKDTVSWTSMMTGFVIQGFADEAIALYTMMQRENTTLDAVTFTCLLQVISQLGSMGLLKALHGRLHRFELLEKDMTLMNTLITSYSKYGALNAAVTLFQGMPEKHLTSWNTMIAAYGMHGDIAQTLKLVDQMKQEKTAPDQVTFKSILSACSHTGLVEEGLLVFRSMQEEYGTIPSDKHYCCIVDLLGRAGKLEEAYDLLKNADQLQNSSALSALLAGCRTHGNWEIGEEVGKRLLILNPENRSAYYSMSKIYTSGGRWDEAAGVESLAKLRGLKRIPGFSLIE